jgi:hypothetical protein
VRFRISVHAGHGAPPDAIERLAGRLGPEQEDARFAGGGTEIVATYGEEAPIAMASDERQEIGRLALLKILEEVCETAPDLDFEWFAVSAGAP